MNVFSVYGRKLELVIALSIGTIADPLQRNGVFTRSSKRPALARVFWIHLLEVCWTFAESCKHPHNVQCMCYKETDRQTSWDNTKRTIDATVSTVGQN